MIGEELRAEIEKPARRRGVGPIQQALGLLLSVLLIWWVFADFGAPPAAVAKDAPSPRVASTSPAITDSLVALGLSAHVVGRSPYCRSVPESVAVVGDLRGFDPERLAIVRPEVLFVQPPLAGVDPALREWCGRNEVRLVEQRIDSLAELVALGDALVAVFGGGIAERTAPARAMLDAPPALPAGAPSVLVVVSADPFLAVGSGNYLDELLVRCGVRNAVTARGWVELSAEAIVALAPDRAVGIAETEAGALDIAGFLAVLPWPGGRPEIRTRAMPEMLSPSFAALARVGELERLVAGAAETAP